MQAVTGAGSIKRKQEQGQAATGAWREGREVVRSRRRHRSPIKFPKGPGSETLLQTGVDLSIELTYRMWNRSLCAQYGLA